MRNHFEVNQAKCNTVTVAFSGSLSVPYTSFSLIIRERRCTMNNKLDVVMIGLEVLQVVIAIVKMKY